MGRFLPTSPLRTGWRPNCAAIRERKRPAHAMPSKINDLNRSVPAGGAAPGKNGRPGLPSAPGFAGLEG